MAIRHGVYDSDTHFIINPITRTLKNEGSNKTTLIQHDHNSERFTFEIPKTIENHDMLQCNVVQIHYVNTNPQTKEQVTGVYNVDDLQISKTDDERVICSWLISQNGTSLVGSLDFLLRFACVNDDGTIEYAWSTAVYSGIFVSTGMYNGDVVEDIPPDILETWKDGIVNDVLDALPAAENTDFPT